MSTKRAAQPSHNEAPPEKLRPSAPEIEGRLLGSVMQSAEALRDVVDVVATDDFRRISHQPIWRAIQAIHRRGEAVDIETVIDELRRRGDLEAVGGAAEISRLTTDADTPMHAKTYAASIRRIAVVNRMIDAALKIHEEAWKEPTDIDGFVDYAVSLIQDARGEAPGDQGPFRLQTVDEMLNQPTPEPLIDGFYSLRSTGILAASPGSGKTALKLDQLAHVALDLPWQGHAVTAGHVVYVCAEGASFLPERLKALKAHLGVSEIQRLRIISAAPQLLSPMMVAGLIASITRQLPELPVWIVIDTLSQTAGGADEVSNSDMARYCLAMAQISEATGAYVEAIHHLGKDESRGLRGASSLQGNCDTITIIKQVGEASNKTFTLHCQKQRGGWVEFRDWSYRLKAQPIDDNAERTGPVIEACDAPPPRKPENLPPNYRMMLDVLGRHPQGLEHSKWCKISGVPSSSFNRGIEALLKLEHITHDKGLGIYRASAYDAATPTSLPWDSHGSESDHSHHSHALKEVGVVGVDDAQGPLQTAANGHAALTAPQDATAAAIERLDRLHMPPQN